MQMRGVVLVEGTSDCRAVETLARRRGRDLRAEGVAIVPMNGYGHLPRLLGQYRDVRLAGLYDVGEERHFLRALGCKDRGELERSCPVRVRFEMRMRHSFSGFRFGNRRTVGLSIHLQFH